MSREEIIQIIREHKPATAWQIAEVAKKKNLILLWNDELLTALADLVSEGEITRKIGLAAGNSNTKGMVYRIKNKHPLPC